MLEEEAVEKISKFAADDGMSIVVTEKVGVVIQRTDCRPKKYSYYLYYENVTEI